jgi:hypothetical protein
LTFLSDRLTHAIVEASQNSHELRKEIPMKCWHGIAMSLAVFCPLGMIAQVSGSGTTGHIVRWTGTTAVGNSNIVQNSGSACVAGVTIGPCVGVGTASPAAHLHVWQNLHGRTTLLKVENAGAFSAATVEVKASAFDRLNDWLFIAQDTGAGATEGLRVENKLGGVALEVAPNLNVGIGTQTPATKLQVAGGDMQTSDAGAGLIVKSPNGALCARIGIDNSGTIAATPVVCP